MENISVNSLSSIVGKFFRRYHLVLFIIIVVGSMAVVIMLMNSALQESNDISSIDSVPLTSFDQATIDRVNALKPSNDQSPLAFPPNQRINPFE